MGLMEFTSHVKPLAVPGSGQGGVGGWRVAVVSCCVALPEKDVCRTREKVRTLGHRGMPGFGDISVFSVTTTAVSGCDVCVQEFFSSLFSRYRGECKRRPMRFWTDSDEGFQRKRFRFFYASPPL